jgi:transcriptional regulator with XRE-family HTH domain
MSTLLVEAWMPSRELPPIGERLKRLREESGLTQRELADRAELTLSLVTKIEQGVNRNLRMQTLVALADALDITLDELVGRQLGEEPPEPPKPRKRKHP